MQSPPLLAMQSLPRFIVVEQTTTNRGKTYLTLPWSSASVDSNAPPGFMNLHGEQVVSQFAKFEVEQSSIEIAGFQDLVHIRSCYNNKYWVAQVHDADHTRYIVASSKNKEEDHSKISCTLFQPMFGTLGQVHFRHVQSQLMAMRRSNVALGMYGGFQLNNVGLGPLDGDVFTIIDWETLVILPSRVTFRSEELDGNYLCSRVIDGFNYQRFEDNLDLGEPRVAKELFVTRDGNYRIRDDFFGGFWRRSPNWIWADADHGNNSDDTLFSFVKISNNVVALRNLGNNNFCGGLTTEGKTNCLNAQYPTLSRQTRLMVEELVVSREISNIRYRLSDIRIYQEEIIEVDTASAVNNSSNSDSNITLSLTITDNRTRNWSASISIMLGVSTTLRFSAVPLIVGGEVEVSTEITTTYEWGETNSLEYERGASYTAVVPPLTTTRVTLMGSRAFCDVPFSYDQRDLLTTGSWVTRTMHDGIFTGVNAYSFYFDSEETPNGNRSIIYK